MKTRSAPSALIDRAFTLIELLVVIVIIAILASIAIPVINIAVAKAQAVQTKGTIHELESAVARYRMEYNHYPIDSTFLRSVGDDDLPAFQTDGSNEAINILTARIDPNQTPNLNPARIPFVHLPMAKNGFSGTLDSSNGQTEGARLALHDLWGQPYVILFDTNYDNRIKNPDIDNGDMIIRRGPAYIASDVLIYSAGPDKIAQTKDDITSWR